MNEPTVEAPPPRVAPASLVMVAILVAGFALVPRAVHAMFKSGEGAVAPAFSLPVLLSDGAPATSASKLSLAQLQGKVVILDFWASWCGPCQLEAPLVNKVAQRFKDRGVVAVGINTSDQAGRGTAWALSKGLTFPIVHDDDEAAAHAYNVDSLPTLVVISRTGRIVATRTGVTDDAELDSLVRQAL
jgi:cytochrome c biogenesis protein CcmG/thiol:disulfide interchange protein DsbE